MVRAKSTLFTGGVGNHVVATAELGSAILVPLLALAAPFVALALVILLLWVAFRMLRRRRRGADQATALHHLRAATSKALSQRPSHDLQASEGGPHKQPSP
jgi:flagellar biogenesis protein FliO